MAGSDDNTVSVSREHLRSLGVSDDRIDELAGEQGGGQPSQAQNGPKQQPTGEHPWEVARHLSEERLAAGATREAAMAEAIGSTMNSDDPRVFVDPDHAFDPTEVQRGS